MNTKKGPDLLSQTLKHFKVNKKSYYSKSEAVKCLETIANNAARAKYPNVPYLAPRTYRDDTANGLTKCVIDFLILSGHHCERTGNEGRIIDNRKAVTDILGNVRMIGSVQRVHGSGMRGTSDLKAVINGQFVAIEIKCEATKDRIRPDQLKYKETIEKSCGLYVIATTFAGFMEWYNQNFRS